LAGPSKHDSSLEPPSRVEEFREASVRNATVDEVHHLYPARGAI